MSKTSEAMVLVVLETIPERGQTECLVETSLSWCIQNSKMILFQQVSTLPPFWNGLLSMSLLEPTHCLQAGNGESNPVTIVGVRHPVPRDAQRDTLSAKVASQARSMLALFTGKGAEIPLPSGSRRGRKDAFKPDH